LTARRYESAEGFKQALEARIRAKAAGQDIARERQLVVFERFLVRVMSVMGTSVVLKGGLALEIRLSRARTTKDVDLRVLGPPEKVLDQLQEAGRLKIDDFMTFEVALDPQHADIENDGVVYGGKRFRAECFLAGKTFGRRFGVDVAFADPMYGGSEEVGTSDVLEFAGIPKSVLRIYPIETHLAEKLHAYTLPRTSPNSRVKDLPDIALLGTIKALRAHSVRGAFKATFEFRNSHKIPTALPSPPIDWETPYAAMALENDLQWASLAEVSKAAQAFLDPVLAASLADASEWSPATWKWVTP